MNKQSGATLSGLLFFIALVGMALFAAARVGPSYYTYWMVERTLGDLLKTPNIQDSDNEALRNQFERQIEISNIKDVRRADLLIERHAGGLHLSVPISAKKSFIGPVSLCVELLAEASN